MMNYTKGEWKVESQNKPQCPNRIYTYDHNGLRYDIADVFIMPISREGAEANAQLIASAPDMYEALKEIMERFNGGTRFPLQSSCDKANEALAKAEK